MASILAGQDPTAMGYRQVVMPPVGAGVQAPVGGTPGYRGNPALANAPNAFQDAVAAWSAHLNRPGDPATEKPLLSQQGALQMPAVPGMGYGAAPAPAPAPALAPALAPAPAPALAPALAPAPAPAPLVLPAAPTVTYPTRAVPPGWESDKTQRGVLKSQQGAALDGQPPIPEYQKAITTGMTQQRGQGDYVANKAWDFINNGGSVDNKSYRTAHVLGEMAQVYGPNSFASLQEQGATQLAQQQMLRDLEAAKLAQAESQYARTPRQIGTRVSRPDESSYPIALPSMGTLDQPGMGAVKYNPIGAAEKPAPVRVVGKTYIDGNGIKSVYQADGTYKIVK